MGREIVSCPCSTSPSVPNRILLLHTGTNPRLQVLNCSLATRAIQSRNGGSSGSGEVYLSARLFMYLDVFVREDGSVDQRKPHGTLIRVILSKLV
jgi:hypothetical protein